jgi:hypothetical protein
MFASVIGGPGFSRATTALPSPDEPQLHHPCWNVGRSRLFKVRQADATA